MAKSLIELEEELTDAARRTQKARETIAKVATAKSLPESESIRPGLSGFERTAPVTGQAPRRDPTR